MPQTYKGLTFPDDFTAEEMETAAASSGGGLKTYKGFTFPSDFTEAEMDEALGQSAEEPRTLASKLGDIGYGAAQGLVVGPIKTAGFLESTIRGEPGVLQDVGSKVDKFLFKAFDQPEKPDFATDVRRGIGQFASMFVPGMAVTKVAGRTAGLATALGLGGTGEFADVFERELTRQDTEGEPRDWTKAMWKSGAYTVGAMALEGKFGVGKVLGQIEGKFGKKVAKSLAWVYARTGLENLISGGLEEATQRGLQDMVVDGTLDPAAIAREGGVGAVVQTLFGVPATAMGLRQKRGEQDAEGVRKDAGQVPPGGTGIQGRTEESSQNIQQQAPEEPGGEREVTPEEAARFTNIRANFVRTLQAGQDISNTIVDNPFIREMGVSEWADELADEGYRLDEERNVWTKGAYEVTPETAMELKAELEKRQIVPTESGVIPSEEAQRQEVLTLERAAQIAPAIGTRLEPNRVPQPTQEKPVVPQQRKPRVVVPGEDEVQPERLTAVQEIKRANATTIRQIQGLWPAAQLTREQARVLRNDAWGRPEQPRRSVAEGAPEPFFSPEQNIAIKKTISEQGNQPAIARIKAAIEAEGLRDADIVWRPGWQARPGVLVEAETQPSGRILVNAAQLIRTPERIRPMVREELAHRKLLTKEGRARVRDFARQYVTPEIQNQLKSLGYEGSEDLMADEFIARQARENTTLWRRIVDHVRTWLSQFGLADLTPDEAARAILRSLQSTKGESVYRAPEYSNIETQVVRHSLFVLSDGIDVPSPGITLALREGHKISESAIQAFKKNATSAGVSAISVDYAIEQFRKFNDILDISSYVILDETPPPQKKVVARGGVLNTAPLSGPRMERLDTKLFPAIEQGRRSAETGALFEGGEERTAIPKEIRGRKVLFFPNVPITQSQLQNPRPADFHYPIVVTGNPHLVNFRRPHPSWNDVIKVVRVKPVYNGTEQVNKAVIEAIRFAKEIKARILITTFRAKQPWVLARLTNFIPTDKEDPEFDSYWKKNPNPRSEELRRMSDYTEYVPRGRKVHEAFRANGWKVEKDIYGKGGTWWWPTSRELGKPILDAIGDTPLEYCDLLHKGCPACRNCQKLTYPEAAGAPIIGITDEPFCEHGCPQCFVRLGQSGIKGRKGISIGQNAKQGGFGDPDIGDRLKETINVLQAAARRGMRGATDYAARFAYKDVNDQLDTLMSLFMAGQITTDELVTAQNEILNWVRKTAEARPEHKWTAGLPETESMYSVFIPTIETGGELNPPGKPVVEVQDVRSIAKQLGITQDSRASDIASRIINNLDVSKSTRALSHFLLDNFGSVLKTAGVERGRSRLTHYDPNFHTVVIGDDSLKKTIGAASRHFLHEAAHAATFHAYRNPNTQSQRIAVEKLDHILRRAVASLPVEMFYKLDSLKRARSSMMAALKAGRTASWKEALTAEGLESLSNNDHLILYHLTSVDELMAGVFNSKTFRKYLDGIDMGEKTLLRRIIDAIRDILGITPGSALEETLESLIMLGEDQSQDYDAAKVGEVQPIGPNENRYSTFIPEGSSIDQQLPSWGVDVNAPVPVRQRQIVESVNADNQAVAQLYGSEAAFRKFADWAKKLPGATGEHLSKWIAELHGGKARIDSPAMLALATYSNDRYGKAMAIALANAEFIGDKLQKAFKPSKTGDLAVRARDEGASLKMSDVLGTKRVDPGAYTFTREQQEAFDDLVKFTDRIADLMVAYGVLKRDELDPAYFFRRALEVPNVIKSSRGGGGVSVGRVPTSAHERWYKTEREGWEKGVKYQTDFNRLLADTIQEVYSSFAAKRLVSNRLLHWETLRQLQLRMIHAATEDKGSALTEEEIDTVKRKAKRAAAKMRVGHQLHAFEGKLFDPKIAAMINDEFQAEQSSWRRNITRAGSMLKGIRFGLDWGMPLIQLLPTFYSNPITWGRSTGYSFLAFADPSVFNQFVRKHPTAVMQLAEQGSPIGQYPEHISGMRAGQILTTAPILKQTIGPFIKRFGRSFQVGLDVAKILLWEARSAVTPRSEWPKLIRQIESQLLIGRAESGFLTHNRAMAERVLLLAPTYYRGFMDFLFGLTQGGVVGRQQWVVMGKFLAGSVAMYVLIAKQLGMDDEEWKKRLNPASPQFMLWRIKDGNQELNIGIGGIFRSIIRLFGQMYAAAREHGADNEFWASKDNPAIRWYRGHSSPAVSGMWDFISGRDYMGREMAGFGSLVPMITPVSWSGSSTTEKASSMFGLTAFPEGVRSFQKRRMSETAEEPLEGMTYPERLRASRTIRPEVSQYERGQTPESRRRSAVFAVEQQEKRAEKLQDDLPGDIRKWLKENELAVPGYSTAFVVGKIHVPLENEEYGDLHEIMVREYGAAIRKLMSQPTFDDAPIEAKSKRLQAVINAARLRARAIFKRSLGKPVNQ